MTDYGDVGEQSRLLEQLKSQGEVSIINPGFGSEQHQLSFPIATCYVSLKNGDTGLLVSNAWYTKKALQVFDLEGNLEGTFFNSKFNQASAMAPDYDDVYITDDATGTIAKLSRDLDTTYWVTNPGDGKLHTRRIGSMSVNDNYLIAYDTALSRIHVYHSHLRMFEYIPL